MSLISTCGPTKHRSVVRGMVTLTRMITTSRWKCLNSLVLKIGNQNIASCEIGKVDRTNAIP